MGQSAVRQTLTNALNQSRIHPALIFTGPRGTGKTSTARIFAKTLRCQHKKELIPCEKCEDCRTIQTGHSLDVVEIDGASNNGVDAIRELRGTVSYSAVSGSYKIYIIDEVHMLSTSAFNALLKTLEEPPQHIVFIMATTAVNKIPRTVLSRCQRLDFHLIAPRPLKSRLEQICQAENISIEEEALWLIAKQARGSLRDGQSLLDQMVNFCNGSITVEEIRNLLGLTDSSLIFDILRAIVRRSEADQLKNIHTFSKKGGEPDILFQNLIESLRDMILLKINPKNSPALVNAGEMEIRQLKELGESVSFEDLHLVFDMLLKAERDLTLCHDRRIALEVLLLRLSQAPFLERIVPVNLRDISLENNKTAPPSDLAGQQGAVTQNRAKSPTVPPPGKRTAQEKRKPAVSSQIPVDRLEKKHHPRENPVTDGFTAGEEKPHSQHSPSNQQSNMSSPSFPGPQSAESPQSLSPSPPFNDQKFSNKKWFAFIEFVKTKDPKLAGCIEALSLKRTNSNTLTLLIPDKSSFLKRVMEAETHRFLEELLNSFMKPKAPLKIKFQNSKELFPTLGEEKRESESKELLQKVKAHPFVRAVNKVFPSEIKSVSKEETLKG